MAGLDGYPGFLDQIVQGDTKRFTIQIWDNTVDPKVPEDITGSKFIVTLDSVRDKDTLPLLEIIIDPPSDPTLGFTAGVITDTQTILLPVGDLFYSIRYIDSTGSTFVIDLGSVSVVAAVSGVIS